MSETMEETLTFTGIEFQALCDRHRDGVLPNPFVFTTDEPMMSHEYEQATREAVDGLERRFGSALHGLVEVLCAPEVFVRVRAWDERDMDNPQKWALMHVARRGTRAYVLRQLPGKTLSRSGGFTATECDPRGLAVTVVDALPKAPPGNGGSIPLVIDPAQHTVPPGTGSFFRDDEEDSDVQRTQKFFQKRAKSTGSIIVVQGRSKYGPRGIHESKMMWRDVVGEGRYVMTLDDSPIAVPTSRKQLIERIQTDIDNLMERIGSHWEPGLREDRV
ncbi:ESX secretion-associated protein EspG [Nocardia sp. CDC159]|nr:ESX secretion-associated protein EspG [Nocardia sp. CDC159]